jgi:hypothetical protein
MQQGPSGRPSQKTLVPTYNNGSNSNLDPDSLTALSKLGYEPDMHG